MSSEQFAIYKKETGVIRQFVNTEEEVIEEQLETGEAYLLNDPTIPVRYAYVDIDGPVIKEQGEMNYTVEGNKITGLPVPCQAVFNGAVYDVTDGTITLDADKPGVYRIRVSSVAYKSEFITVVVS